ncbi:hypothetical protein NE634_13805 [Lacrimispora saccharolytica]|nr:hypothetical protein [Lacrimispora saccharolytica]
MKKAWKKLMTLVLMLSVFMAASMMAEAKNYKLGTTVLTYQKEFGTSLQIESSQKAVKKLKSSKPSVASVTCKRQNGEYAIIIKMKKPGTTVITYTSGSDTFEEKVVVKKYQNMIKKITINGKDITSKFNKKGVCTLSYKKYKNKNVKIQVIGKKNWSTYHGDYYINSRKILKCMPSPNNKTYSFKLTQKKGKLGFSVDQLNGSNYVLYEIRFK